MRSGLRHMTILLVLAAPAGYAGEAEETLWEAARAGNLETIKRLQELDVDLDARTRYNASALSFACDKGHVDVVRHLLDAGVEVNVKDSFYGFTPLAWTLINDHEAITLLLLEHGAEGAEQVLTTGVRKGSVKLVQAALANPSIDADHVATALELARETGDREEIVKLLESAEVRPPERPQVEVDLETLQKYVGTYRDTESGMVIELRVEDGKLVGQAAGQPPLVLRPLAADRFEAVERPQMKISVGGRGGTVERVIVEQGSRTQVFRPYDPTEAPPEVAEAEEEAPSPETPAAPREIVRLPARNWPSFRGGPQATGVADGQGAPVEWDATTGRGVRWKTPIPGLANSSPVIWGKRIFVTTAISSKGDDTFRTGVYGDVGSVDDLSEHTFKLYALNGENGKISWERTVATTAPGVKRHFKATQANSSPATDGKHVVVLFGSVGVLACYGVNGKPHWKIDVGVLDSGWFYDKSYQWGHASSPLIYDDLVIIQTDVQQDSYIAAYKLSDGSLAWKTPRDEIPSWGSPAIWRGKDGDELITNGTTIRGYDPKTGRELWQLGPNSELTVSTPVVAEGLVYVTGGYPPVRPVYAIRPGGRGDLSLPEGTDSSERIAWSYNKGGTYLPTPLVYEGLFYTCSNNGRLTVYDAATGEIVYRQRIADSGAFTASPIAADGRLYFAHEDGDVYVIRAGRKYEELAVNPVGEVLMATPAISDGLLVIRSLNHVYGIGAEQENRIGG